MRIAFAGNPNSGKTTMYNVLTGKNERVGNWAGVTVGKKESRIKREFAGQKELTAVDLPGAYSMSPFTPEEGITSRYVRDENPDVIVNVVDATNLSRSLFFTTQLMELGVPVIIALNKSDINKKNGTVIKTELLSRRLGCPVIETVSVSSDHRDLAAVIEKAVEFNGTKQIAPYIQPEIDLNDKSEVEAEDRKRFDFVNQIVKETEKRRISIKERNLNDMIDAVLTNKFGGWLIFAAVMWAVFWISQSKAGPFVADFFVGLIEMFQGWLSGFLEGSSPLLKAVLIDGIVGGVGAVVGFLPLVMVMYFLIAILEDCGYMARVSVVMDPVFKRVGLSGKSIIPIIIGTGCGIPAIMASRTIRDERERRATAMLTTFIPCGAKIPVIALFAGAFFSGASWVNMLMYIMGISLIFMGALLIKAVTGHKYRKSFFVMELPDYKLPSIRRAFFLMIERAKSYIIKASTIILVCNCAVQLMQTFNWQFEVVGENAADTSILASIAYPFSVLLIPLGFGVWQLAAAAITGFIAKENVVGTLAVVYAITNFIDTEKLTMVGGANEVAAAMGLTSVTALAYLIFNLFTPPCFAAIGAMNSEMKSAKWLWGAIGLQMGIGYTLAFIVYQLGTLITEGRLGEAFLPGLTAVILMVLVIVFIAYRSRMRFDREYSFADKRKGEAV